MNILRSHREPPFEWFMWTPLNKDGVPGIELETALKQPETIKESSVTYLNLVCIVCDAKQRNITLEFIKRDSM